MTLQLTVLGCSGSGPAPGAPASGYLIRSSTESIWADAGSGTFHELSRHLDPADLSAVTISHLHADHSVDFLGYFHYVAYRCTLDRPIPVFLPPGGIARFAAYLQAGQEHALHRVFVLEEMEGETSRRVGDVTLRFAPAHHSAPTNAVRFESGGRSLVFSGDTGPGGGFEHLAQGADVALCEAGLGEPPAGGTPQHHLSGADAGRIAERARVGRLILTHLAPTLPPEDIRAAAAEEYSGPIVLAEPGMHVAV